MTQSRAMHGQEENHPARHTHEPSAANWRPLRSRLLLAAIGLSGLIASVLVYAALLVGQRRLIDRQFSFDATQALGDIQHSLSAHLQVVRSLRAFYDASKEVERNEFHDFAGALLLAHPGMQQLAWAPLVTAGQRDERQSAASQPGNGNDPIREANAQGVLIPAKEREEYLPLRFLQPEDRAAGMSGFDLGADPESRAAIARARDTGDLAATGCIRFPPADGKPSTILVVAPIYRRGTPRDTPAARRENFKGVVLGVFHIGTIVERTIDRNSTEEMEIHLFDGSLPKGRQFLYVYPPQAVSRTFASAEVAAGSAGIQAVTMNDPPGHAWSIYGKQTATYVARRETWLPPVVLFGGILITGLVVMYCKTLIDRTIQVERLVVQRAAEIQHANQQLAREVAEHQRTEQVLRESEVLYASLVENLPVQILRKDLEGRFNFANQSFCDLLGKSLEEILGKTDFDFYAASLAEKYRRDDQRVIETGQLFEDVEEYRKDGQTRYVQVMKIAVHDAAGRIVGMQAIFWDVTHRKEAEAALAQEQYLLHALMDNLPDAIYYKDRESHFLRISRALADRFGMKDSSEAVGKTDADFFDAEHAADARADEEEVMRTGQPLVGKVEKEIWLRDGRETWASTTKLPLYDADGQVIGTFGISRNVTERKRAEEALLRAHEELELRVRERTAELQNANQALQAEITERKWVERTLRESETRLREIIDLVPHMIFAKDMEGRFLLANRTTAAAYQMTVEQLTGKRHADVHADEAELKQMLEADRAVIESGRPRTIPEESFVNAKGEVRFLQTIKIPYTASGTSEPAILGVSIDITELKAAEDELRKAHDQLEVRVQQRTAELARANAELARAKEASEAASRAKSAFLANMSHEIRTPMNAIIGMTELVLDTELVPEQREYLTVVQESGETLLSLINDILDFSKIEADRLVLDRSLFDLHESLADTMRLLAIRAHGKGLELACHIPPEVPVAVVGDRTRLGQIVVNLVGNAIKFTESGEVVLDVRRLSQTDDSVTLRFAVRDTGIGIAKENLQIIFEEFEQADNTTTRRFGGSGLGLAIASKLVELMQGSIWVESELGRGSTFHFTARFGLPESAAAAPTPEPGIVHGLRVLVVDDNATNRRILEEMLHNWNMEPKTVSGVADALQWLERAYRAAAPYHLVLTDANMPETDGFTLAERIKADPHLSSTIIMMLTSGDRPGDVARCERLGVAAYLLKPIKQSELLDAIMMALGVSAETHGGPQLAADRPRQLSPLQILLAEDSLVNQKLAVGLLERQGHTVHVANNGKEAVAAWQSRPFDLVIMDVQMPEMDGLEATATIRQKEKQTGAHIPIVAMTAHAMKGDRERCLAAGMDQYITKPIRAKRLLETIGRAIGVQAETPPTAELPTSGADVLNWSEALHTVGGDHDLLRGVVEAFLEETPRLTREIGRAVAGGDCEALRVASHALKGAVRYLGAGRVFENAWKLEKMGHDRNLLGAEPILAEIEVDMARLMPVLLDYTRSTRSAEGPPPRPVAGESFPV